MANKELLKTIRKEIISRIDKRHLSAQAKNELVSILSFLSTLESEKPINLDDAMKELDEKIALVKERGTWDGVDVDKYMDEVRGREPEKPMNLEELEDEMDRFFETMPVLEHENIFEDTFKNIARHFYDLGCRRTAEKFDEIEYNRQRAEESGSSEIPNDHDERVPEIKETGTQGLDEAAKQYVSNIAYCDEDVELAKEQSKRDFIAGAKWQKQHDAELIEIAYNDGITIGMTKQKEQMLKDAVEGPVITYADSPNTSETKVETHLDAQ